MLRLGLVTPLVAVGLHFLIPHQQECLFSQEPAVNIILPNSLFICLFCTCVGFVLAARDQKIALRRPRLSAAFLMVSVPIGAWFMLFFGFTFYGYHFLSLVCFPLVVLGGFSNALARVLNGGSMPVTPEAIKRHGRGFSHSPLYEEGGANIKCALLVDRFYWPFLFRAGVFSIGDLMISIGLGSAGVLLISSCLRA